MISGVSYNAFNGEEHLLSSLKFSRKNFDFINIVAQRISNVGNPAPENLEQIIQQAFSENLVDSVIWYHPDLALPPVINELQKRREGLEAAKKAGVTHFMTMDCDEYYSPEEFSKAKDMIIGNKIKASCVRTYLHIKRPIWRSKIPDSTCCSFLTEIDKKSTLDLNSFYPALVDGTRRLHGDSDRFHMFSIKDISMKHMNLVRHNLESKLANSSNFASTDFMNGVREAYQNWKFGDTLNFPGKPPFEIIHVDDLFEIDHLFCCGFPDA